MSDSHTGGIQASVVGWPPQQSPVVDIITMVRSVRASSWLPRTVLALPRSADGALFELHLLRTFLSESNVYNVK